MRNGDRSCGGVNVDFIDGLWHVRSGIVRGITSSSFKRSHFSFSSMTRTSVAPEMSLEQLAVVFGGKKEIGLLGKHYDDLVTQ
jgi:hypothetical protein